LDLFFSNSSGHVPSELKISKEELYTLLKSKLHFYPLKKTSQIYNGNFLQFLDFAYKNNLPISLTADPILFAANENLRMITIILNENYLFPLLAKFYNDLYSEIRNITVEELKFSVKEIKKFLAIFFELIKYKINFEELDFPTDIPQVQYLHILEAIRSYNSRHTFELFGNEHTIDFLSFRPKGVFTQSQFLANIINSVNWLSQLKLSNANNIQVIWIFAKAIHSAKLTKNYIVISDMIKYFFEGYDVQENFKTIYEIGEQLGYKDYLLKDEEKALLYRRLLKTPNSFLDVMNYDFKTKVPTLKKETTQVVSIFPKLDTLSNWFIPNTFSGKQNKFITSIAEFSFSVLNNLSEVPLLTDRARTNVSESKTAIHFRDGVDIFNRLHSIRQNIQRSMKNETDKWRKHFSKHILLILSNLNNNARERRPTDNENEKDNLTYEEHVHLSKLGFTSLGSYTHLYNEESYFPNSVISTFSSGGFKSVYVEPNIDFFEELKMIFTKLNLLLNSINEVFPDNKEEVNQPLLKKFTKIEYALNLLISAKANQLKGVEDETIINDLNGMLSSDNIAYNGWYLDLFNDPNTNKKEENLFDHNFSKHEFHISTPDFDKFFGSICNLYLNKNLLGLSLVKNKNHQTGNISHRIMLFSTYNPMEIVFPYSYDTSVDKIYKMVEVKP